MGGSHPPLRYATGCSSVLLQRGAKLDKSMADGRTSLIKAMEGNDMPMIDTLLAADRNQNFTDKRGFMYQMVELYQREDRGIS